MMFNKTIVTLACVSLLGACASRPNNGKLGGYSGPVPKYYVVRSGDTVGKIAKRYGLDYRQIGRINNLDSNYTILVNQKLKLTGKVKPRKKIKQYNTPAQRWNAREIDQSRINQPTPRPKIIYNKPVDTNSWFKPTAAPIIQSYNPSAGIKGIRYGGNLGDPIYASKEGDVIYANNGLVEYGNLILIRHADGYITAYAHNNNMLVKEGSRVSAGTKIATMGSTGTDKVMLEFQVRKDGKAIDPKIVLGQ